jgi:hypothetical protein
MGHDREIGQRRDRPLAEQGPDGLDLGLQRGLPLFHRIWKRHAEERETFPGGGERILVARQVLVLEAAQTVDLGQIEAARGVPQQ